MITQMSKTFELSTLNSIPLTPNLLPELEDAKKANRKEAGCVGYPLIKGCGHFISKESHCISVEKDDTCAENENPCALCKNPSNIRLPIFDRYVRSILHKKVDKLDDLTLDKLLSIIISDENEKKMEEAGKNSRFTEEDLEIIKSQIINCDVSLKHIYKFYYSNIIIRKKMDIEDNSPPLTSPDYIISGSLLEMLQVSQVKGLAATIKQFGKNFNLLYTLHIISCIHSFDSLYKWYAKICRFAFKYMIDNRDTPYSICRLYSILVCYIVC